jgi:hypothetical protein
VTSDETPIVGEATEAEAYHAGTHAPHEAQSSEQGCEVTNRLPLDGGYLAVLNDPAAVDKNIGHVATVGVEHEASDEIRLVDRLAPWRHDVDQDDVGLLPASSVPISLSMPMPLAPGWLDLQATSAPLMPEKAPRVRDWNTGELLDDSISCIGTTPSLASF